MNRHVINIIRPGFYSLNVRADARRLEFDSHNESIMEYGLPIDAVFIGDSITEYWALDVFFNPSKRIVNRGIGGDTTTYIIKRFAADVLQLKPRFAVIKAGINNTAPLDNYLEVNTEVFEDVYNEICSDIEVMINIAREHGVDPVICSLLPTCNELSRSMGIRNQLVAQVNERLQQITSKSDALYVDYHSRVCSEDGLTLKSDFTYDGVHLNAYGYKVLADTLKKVVPL